MNTCTVLIYHWYMYQVSYIQYAVPPVASIESIIARQLHVLMQCALDVMVVEDGICAFQAGGPEWQCPEG